MLVRPSFFSMLLAVGMVISAGTANANIIISGTRVIYPADEREVTVKLSNEGKTPVLAQVWLDDGDASATPGSAKVPFALTPPLSRIDPRKGQHLRLMYTHDALPKDKESLFWLNVLEVPPRAEKGERPQNMLQLAIRSRIKVFFRPAGLPGDPRDAAAKVHWAWRKAESGNYVLTATNPTPYHVTFSKLTASAGNASYESEAGGMVAPGATQEFPVGHLSAAPAGALKVKYTFLNDYGGGSNGDVAAP
ncbi:fimbria/pilus periplasmic chaperone [Pseudoduganella sp. R-43]|uniref:fimbria/pilus periplasmic chaperone n=1 Tax=unclassified Pseudoduganella TaxID=2637179 RepID=UPI003CF89FD9